jgi:hypothetical protein
MEKQMQAERTRRAAILTAEGDKRAAILKSEGEKESAILRAEGEQRAAILRAEGEAEAYRNVQAAQIEMTGALFERLESSDLSPESLRYLYLKALPEMAQGPASKLFVVPSEIQDLAGTLSALAGGASLATEDGSKGEEKQRRLEAPNGEPASAGRTPCRPARASSGSPDEALCLSAGYRRRCCSKKRTISAEASGPLGSVYEPGWLPPDQA